MVGLAPSKFNALIHGASQDVQWRPAALCPCRNALSGAANPSCPTCAGRGVVWGPSSYAWCVPSGMRIQRAWQQSGQFELGDLVVLVGSDSPLYQAGESDRILLSDSTEPFQAVLNATGSETLGWPAASVSQVFWLDPTTQAQVQGGIPGVQASGVVDWSVVQGGPAPPAGMQYSISGRRVPEFFIFQNLPGDRAHFQGRQLPRRMLFRKFDLFGR